MFPKKTIIILVAFILWIPICSYAGDVLLTNDGKVPGQPFQYLQQQIDQLKLELQNIQLKPGPPGSQGPQGLPGPKGPAGIGNLGVYDGSGLFLGYFIQTIFEASYEIFNPEIRAFLQVVFQNPPSLMGFAPNSDFYYMSEDCSGEPYFLLNRASFFQELFNYPYRSNTYYIFDATSPIVQPHDLKSWMPPNMVCYRTEIHPPPTNPETPYAAFPIKHVDKVDIPLLNRTLQYPIIVKAIE